MESGPIQQVIRDLNCMMQNKSINYGKLETYLNHVNNFLSKNDEYTIKISLQRASRFQSQIQYVQIHETAFDYTQIVNELVSELPDINEKIIQLKQKLQKSSCIICTKLIEDDLTALKSCDYEYCKGKICGHQCYYDFFIQIQKEVNSYNEIQLCSHPLSQKLIETALLHEELDQFDTQSTNQQEQTIQKPQCHTCFAYFPRIELKCQHNICQYCINQHIRNWIYNPVYNIYIKCVCGVNSKIVDGEVNNLLMNSDIGMKKKAKQVLMQLSNQVYCFECGTQPDDSSICKTCSSVICLDCGKAQHTGECEQEEYPTEEQVVQALSFLDFE